MNRYFPDAEVVLRLEAEPGWAWYRCEVCGEIQYRRRLKQQARCGLTPACSGSMVIHLDCTCVACGGVVPTRRRSDDPRFCSKPCAKQGGPVT